ncbi:hypothetical protein L4D04_22430 [Photobacterium angustum]|uniref:Uncharacterized protein n=1 Tax=Photobacterium angustum (strain S14 / CCUG 15956) TaxID=314292 RepID=Q1ZSP9_PHOAS|nr:hypothetical protein [Photobacterium angustum]EAS64928.1 hypothetical protein VAS14_04393 [Photobacterium angustum S14]
MFTAPLYVLFIYMKYTLKLIPFALVVLLAGCGGGSTEEAKEPDPTPKPPKVIESGGYVLSGVSNRNVELSIVSNNQIHCMDEAVFIVQDDNGQSRRLYALFPDNITKDDIRLGEYHKEQEPNLISGLKYHANILIEPLPEIKQIKITFDKVDKEFEEFGFEEGQTLYFKKISQYIEFSELDKLSFHSNDYNYDLNVIDNQDGTGTLQGNQADLSCTIEGSLQSVQEGDIRSYYIDTIAYKGCKDKKDDGAFFASMYTYITNNQMKIKLLANPPNVQDSQGKGGVSIDLTAN